MGAALAWGDFSAGGIGTLTAVSKDGRFLAFAHPMFNKGSVAYAMMDANIVKIIPSMESSFKLGYLNKITGLVTQDRPEAIGGELGKLAAASSYAVRFKNIEAFECGDDLIVDAVTLDASAAEGQHDAFSGGNELRQTGDLALAENQFGRIVIDEVVHGEYLFILLRRE